MAEEKKYKVILLDDDEFLVDMYSVKFDHAGALVESFKSGPALLEKLKGGLVGDLILLDIVMPGMDGLEVLREIRKNKLAESIPIVMLTNQNDEKDITTAKALGVSGYIVKSSATPTEVVEESLKIIKNSA
jgi:CheY-like chemotaxis protein